MRGQGERKEDSLYVHPRSKRQRNRQYSGAASGLMSVILKLKDSFRRGALWPKLFVFFHNGLNDMNSIFLKISDYIFTHLCPGGTKNQFGSGYLGPVFFG